MATLQKFKLLSMQCGVSQSPTRSPRTSPLVQLRRRKTTLRMLLSWSAAGRRSPRRREPALQRERLLEKKGGDLVRRHSLKDLFVTAPPGEEDITNEEIHRVANADLAGSGYGPGSPRPGWKGFRSRPLVSKKAWRPVLLAIAE
ncbi:uncharacterized protein LOC133311191 [Gastrolobium bilobum]|uniref:uncharacterized protein LOC133311191 n=1 Tax=Gastrolobium bilobum TaxID=150636 RepID=UPI002AB23392|nr:uncharacterized protein LOC133311191 [Gastrolobium bilobum]